MAGSRGDRGDRGRRGKAGRGRGRGRGHDDLVDGAGELNANLNERIGRSSARQAETKSDQLPVVLNKRIGQYLRNKPIARGAPDWTVRSEIPSIEELLPYDSFPSDYALSRRDTWTKVYAHSASNALGWDDSPEFTSWDALPSRGPTGNAGDRRDPQHHEANDGWGDGPKNGDAWASHSPREIAAGTHGSSHWDDSAQDTDAWDRTETRDDAWGVNDDHNGSSRDQNQNITRSESGNIDDEWNNDTSRNAAAPADVEINLHNRTSDDQSVNNAEETREQIEDGSKPAASESDLLRSNDAPAGTSSKGEVLPSWDDSQTTKDAWDVDNNDPWDAVDPVKEDRNAKREIAWEVEVHASDSGDRLKAQQQRDWEGASQDDGTRWNSNVGTAARNAPDEWATNAAAVEWTSTNGHAKAGEQDGENDEQQDESFDSVQNKIEGPWNSKAEYLRNHYLLLREDSLRELRVKLKYFRENIDLREDPSTQGLGIYDQVHVCGITLSNRGLGVKVSFSLGRVGKHVRWEQSPRLKTGSLVVLMTPDNAICKVAVVAARTLESLSRDPPEIDLFLSRGEDMDIDCSQEWIMLEERNAYFEAQRHTMTALQRMMHEDFPMQQYLVNVEPTVDAPDYLRRVPERDLSGLFQKPAPHINLLEAWPDFATTLDDSQVNSLKRILTKRLALVQGPPGTGKTHVSVQALKVLLANMGAGDPPIVVACQTNHALDQILRHVAVFEPNFARLGGRSQDKEIVGKRTVFELKGPTKTHNFREFKAFEALKREIAELIGPLVKTAPQDMDALDIDQLEQLDVLKHAQVQSLKKGAEKWKSHDPNPAKNDPMILWVGERNLERVQVRRLPVLVGWETEEPALDTEEVQEADAENVARDDDDEIERLKGEYYMIGDTWTGKCLDAKSAMQRAETALKAHTDLYKIKSTERGGVYRYLQKALKTKIKERLVQLWPKYEALVEARRIWTYESHEVILREQKVIGMTTTGLSKYRGLIAAIQPKVVLIEEAAETLEAPVTAGCVESLEHLILVGDHKQLRPHCNIMDLERGPYHLNISMFERLVMNGIEFSLLRRQRRMKPEIRRLLLPIYGGKIKDHKKVHEQDIVPGMGGLSSWFLTHEAHEARDEDFSVYNPHEADMVFGLVQYLIYNGMKDEEITILTFYRAQVRRLQKLLRNFRPGVKVVTVDSYQGEENEVVIISLVRSSVEGKIGFVSNENRICVALSRAKRGFYMFGNAQCLAGESRVWTKVITDLKNGAVGKEIKEWTDAKFINKDLPKRRIGFVLPLWCVKHQRMTFIKSPEDWASNVGGCNAPCRGTLICGHPCPERCHPWDHQSYNNCKAACKEVMDCGHHCSLPCKEFPHVCKACATKEQIAQLESRSQWPKQREKESSHAEFDADRPLSPSSSRLSEARMGRLLDADFEGLNVGGDGYTYDSMNRPTVQGQAIDDPPALPASRSPSNTFKEVYRADVLAQEHVRARDSSQAGRHGYQDEPRAVRHEMSGALQPRTSVSQASQSGAGSRPRTPAEGRAAVKDKKTISKEQTLIQPADDFDLLGDENTAPVPAPPAAPSQYRAELSLLD